MKKIVAGLAALAMAASVFAVDVASMIQLDGNLMAYDKTNGFRAIELNEWDPQGSSDYVWKLSASGDKSGATIWNWTNVETDLGDIYGKQKLVSDYELTEYSVWIKPADWVKITFGNVYDCSIFNPQFGWWAKNMEAAGYGIQCDFTFDALSFTLSLMPGKNTFWFADGKIGSFYADVVYNFGSVGSAQLYFGKGITQGVHGVDNWANGAYVLGAVWGNQPYMQNGYFADINVGFTNKFKFDRFDAQIGGQFFTNGIGLQLTNALAYLANLDFRYGFELKASYALDSWTPYIVFDGYNIIGSTNWGAGGSWDGTASLGLKLGVGTSVGACAIDAYLSLPIAFKEYSFNFSVPVQFTIYL